MKLVQVAAERIWTLLCLPRKTFIITVRSHFLCDENSVPVTQDFTLLDLQFPADTLKTTNIQNLLVPTGRGSDPVQFYHKSWFSWWFVLLEDIYNLCIYRYDVKWYYFLSFINKQGPTVTDWLPVISEYYKNIIKTPRKVYIKQVIICKQILSISISHQY